ncbi:hypothetical protein SALBM311S_00288 [Streptomyces alboniger]
MTGGTLDRDELGTGREQPVAHDPEGTPDGAESPRTLPRPKRPQLTKATAWAVKSITGRFQGSGRFIVNDLE